MLKIRDDIKLSILKKYGFERIGRSYIIANYSDGWGFIPEDTEFRIIVHSNRTIEVICGAEVNGNDYVQNYFKGKGICLNDTIYANSSVVMYFMEIFYDLIKDNLVEKIGNTLMDVV